MKYATVVNTVYGNKVILCKTAKRALELAVFQKDEADVLGFITVAHKVNYNKQTIKVPVRNKQKPNSFGMIKFTNNGPVVTIYEDGYKLASDLLNRPGNLGAIVVKDGKQN